MHRYGEKNNIRFVFFFYIRVILDVTFIYTYMRRYLEKNDVTLILFIHAYALIKNEI